jgi:hypothetical protein
MIVPFPTQILIREQILESSFSLSRLDILTNIRGYRRDYHKWTIERNWQHRRGKTEQKHNTIGVGHHHNNFARFGELPAHRLCKIVFMELKKNLNVMWNGSM